MLRLLLEEDLFPPALSCMSYFRTTISSVGHPMESIEKGNTPPMSSWNDQVVNPDTVAPWQQDITQLDDGRHQAKHIGTQSIGIHTDETESMDTTFLFSNICFQSMAHTFHSCDIFSNTIYRLFGYADDMRSENTSHAEEILHGQPFFSEKAVSTVDFTDGLPPANIFHNKEEQTRHSALSGQNRFFLIFNLILAER